MLYLDPSSVIKLYMAEAGADRVHQLVNDAAVVATSNIRYTKLAPPSHGCRPMSPCT